MVSLKLSTIQNMYELRAGGQAAPALSKSKALTLGKEAESKWAINRLVSATMEPLICLQ